MAASVGEADYYIARYTQGKKYAISISTPMETQIVAVGSATVPLVSVVNIFTTITPISGIGVDFVISTYPVGATCLETISLLKASLKTLI